MLYFVLQEIPPTGTLRVRTKSRMGPLFWYRFSPIPEYEGDHTDIMPRIEEFSILNEVAYMLIFAYNPIFGTYNNQKGSKPFYNQGFRAFLCKKKCGYFFSFFVIVQIFFIFLFDTISKSVRKPDISCRASVMSVLS